MPFMNGSLKPVNVKNSLLILFGEETLVSRFSVQPIQLDDVRAEYRRKAKLFHPDRRLIMEMSEIELTEKFRLINEAYLYLHELLKNGKKIVRRDKSVDQAMRMREQGYRHPFEEDSYPTTRRGNFFSGTIIPQRPLRLAEFLFYQRVIDRENMVMSLLWQRRHRPLLGQIARNLGYLAREEISTILKRQKRALFGETAIVLKLLDRYRLMVICGTQKKYNLPIGRYFLERNVLSEKSLEGWLEKQREYNYEMKYRKVQG